MTRDPDYRLRVIRIDAAATGRSLVRVAAIYHHIRGGRVGVIELIRVRATEPEAFEIGVRVFVEGLRSVLDAALAGATTSVTAGSA